MIYRVCEHYDDNQPVDIVYDNECFICFELTTINELRPITLKNQPFYFKMCECNGSVHNECLKIWYSLNKTCPICRKNMFEKESTFLIVLAYIPYGINCFIYIKRVFLHFLRYLSIIYLFYSIFDFYLSTIIIREFKYDTDFPDEKFFNNNTF